MLFTIARPVSKRFIEIRFNTLFPYGRNKLILLIKTFSQFLKWLVLCYLTTKVKKTVKLIGRIVVWVVKSIRDFKSFFVAKLIWSRGRLGRPIANFIVIVVGALYYCKKKVENHILFIPLILFFGGIFLDEI